MAGGDGHQRRRQRPLHLALAWLALRGAVLGPSVRSLQDIGIKVRNRRLDWGVATIGAPLLPWCPLKACKGW